jgi:hypothetical protein
MFLSFLCTDVFMQVLRVHHNLKMCKYSGLLLQIVKSEREKQYFIQKN